MKKVIPILLLILVMTLTVALPVIALAEEAGAALPNDYMTPEDFATFAGQVVFVVALVQFLKIPADGWFGGHIKTEYVVYIVSVIGQVLARMILPNVAGVLTWGAVPTILIWALCVAYAAMKSYSVIIAKVEGRKAALADQNEVQTKQPNAEGV